MASRATLQLGERVTVTPGKGAPRQGTLRFLGTTQVMWFNRSSIGCHP